MKIQLLAKSSGGSSYKVSFSIEHNHISAVCQCKAGENNMLCKHVIGLLAGDISMLYRPKKDMDSLDCLQKHMPDYQLHTLCSTIIDNGYIINTSEIIVKEARKKVRKVVISYH